MNDKKFTSKTISDPDGKDLRVKFTDVKDMFNFRGQPPIVCVSTTKGGKTVFAIDLLYKYAKQARYVYYVSETGKNMMDEKTTSIPGFIVRDPSKSCFDTISRIWNDIQARGEAFKADETIYRNLFKHIYPGVDVIGEVNRYVESLDIDSRSKLVVKSEIFTRIIIDRVNTEPKVLEKLAELRDGMTYIDLVNSKISKSNKTLVILDDMTTAIERAASDKAMRKVAGQVVRGSEAVRLLFKDMFQRARHYNCLIVMFIHEIKPFQTIMGNITNYMFLNYGAFGDVARKGQFVGKDYFEGAIRQLKIFDDYKYHAVFCNTSTREIKVTRADLHDPDEKMELHPDTLKFQDLLIRIQQADNEEVLVAPEIKPEEPNLELDGDSENLFEDDIRLDDV